MVEDNTPFNEEIKVEFPEQPTPQAEETMQMQAEEVSQTEQTPQAEGTEQSEQPLVVIEGKEDKEPLPFPAEDYDEQGKLKRVRKRMLKKLLKYEFRAIFPYLFTLIFGLLGLAILFGVHMRICDSEKYPKLENWLVLTVMLYIFANLGTIIVAYAKSYKRFKDNFFSNEGYLTFSIPATAEEHLLAKHLSMLISVWIAQAAIWIGIFFVICIADAGAFVTIGRVIGDFFKLYGTMVKAKPFHLILLTIEFLLLSLVGIPLIPCILGAAVCLTQKYEEKKKFSTRIIFIVIGFVAYYVINILLVTTGVLKYVFTPVGMHITLWLMILATVATTVGCFLYERKVLTRRLNLQ